MTNKEQRDWIKGLIDGVTTQILNKSKDFPEDWDGSQLRLYVKDQFDKVVWSDHQNKRLSLYKKYYKDCLINNL